MTTFLLVRHGETEWNRLGRIQGHSDSPLTGEGVAQARAIGERLAGEAIDSLIASDAGRAMHTATLIAARTGLPIEPDSRLRERCYGVAEGLHYAEIGQQYPLLSPGAREANPHYAAPGAESIVQFHERIVAAISDLQARYAGKRALIVTHGGVLAVVYRWLNGLPVTSGHSIEIPNVAYNRIHFDAGKWRVEVWADTDHLPLVTDAEPI